MKFLTAPYAFFKKAWKIKCGTIKSLLSLLPGFIIAVGMIIRLLCNKNEWQMGISLVASFVIGISLVFPLEYILSKTVEQNKNLDEDEKCRVYIMILSCGTTVIGIVFLIFSFVLVEETEEIRNFSIFLGMLLPLLLLCAIIPKLQVCYIFYQHHTFTVVFISLLHLLLFFINLYIDCFYLSYSSDTVEQHILFLCGYAPSSIDFIIALNGGVKIGDLGQIEERELEKRQRKEKEKFDRESIRRLERMEASTVSG